jgi:hypothetical protein
MAEYNDSVFINCPFDESYSQIFRSIIFTTYKCGLVPVTALAEDDSSENRLNKIERLIEGCRYGIHDISRIELNANGLPRFNMPFELGLFFGAKRFGNKLQKNKVAIVLDIHQYRYLEFISDLSGVDIKSHENNPEIAIQKLRDWFKTSTKRTSIPGHKDIVKEYRIFLNKLPDIVTKLGLEIKSLSFNDFCYIVEEYLNSIL